MAKVILRNVLETTWNDNACSLNIFTGPKVVDTTFKDTHKEKGSSNKTPALTKSMNIVHQINSL